MSKGSATPAEAKLRKLDKRIRDRARDQLGAQRLLRQAFDALDRDPASCDAHGARCFLLGYLAGSDDELHERLVALGRATARPAPGPVSNTAKGGDL